MLPTTTRKHLRIPHHVAIVCAAICLGLAFYVEAQRTHWSDQDNHATAQGKERAAFQVEAPQKREARHTLPRLLPWTTPKPKS